MNLQIFREERYSKKAKFVVAILVLIICLFFPFYSNYKLAVSGITFTVDLEVLSINSCSSKETACRFNADKLEIGDQILRIGDLSREEIAADRRLAPFGDAEPGDIVPVTIDRAGKVLSYEIQMVRPNLINIIILVFTYMLVFGPFWLVGFYLSLYLAPTDSRWRLQVAFYFYTALWIAIGTQAAYKYLFSSLIQHALSWMLVPIYIHFHLVTPASLLQKGKRKLLIPLYIIAAALAVMELFQFLPKLAYLVGILSAIICSIIILAYRAIAKREQAEKITARIMISGVIIAFGPGILLWVIPKLVEARMPGSFATIVIFLALPILPLSYGYGIYKRWLGQIESRLNRFLSRYSLFTLYLIFFSIISLLASSRQLNLTSPDIMYSTIILSAFF